jgi:hypothetical protein
LEKSGKPILKLNGLFGKTYSGLEIGFFWKSVFCTLIEPEGKKVSDAIRLTTGAAAKMEYHLKHFASMIANSGNGFIETLRFFEFFE